MRVWNKLIYPNEINFLAIEYKSCDVEEPRSVIEEMDFRPEKYDYHPWRQVEIIGEKCKVKKFIQN
jgi:hypothetical protein